MNWRFKALLFKIIARMPPAMSYRAHYLIQRYSGTLRKDVLDPMSLMKTAIEICDRINGLGRTPVGGVFMEIGTGRRLNLPVAFWLCGAAQTITVDISPYLLEELVKEDLEFLRNNPDRARALFGNRLDETRFDRMLRLADTNCCLGDLMDLCSTKYLLQTDSAHIELPSGSVDFQVSRSVFEHVPPDDLASLISECSRIVRDDGLLINVVDFTDHFSHSDKSISLINFLRFSDRQWLRIAGNRYAYANRLRIDDILDLLKREGNREVDLRCETEDSLLDLLGSGELELDPRFINKSHEALSTVCACIVSEKDHEDAEHASSARSETLN